MKNNTFDEIEKKENFRDILEVDGVKAKGFGIIPKMVMLDRKLTIEAKAIYSYFCSYAGAGTTAFPSLEKILNDLQISKTRYYNHFNLLKNLGYIKVEQVKSNTNKFSHNIYKLIENPIIKPSTQNEETEKNEDKKPFPNFEYTGNETPQNKTTKNNISSFKNNNLSYNNQSVSQEENKKNQPIQEKTDGQTEYQNIKALFKDKLKFNDLKISHATEKKLIDEIELNILEMFFNEYTIIYGQKQPKEIVRNSLLKLTYWHLDTLISKYIEKSSTTQIKNPKAYIQAMIYNIAFENELAITNELKYIGAI